MLKKRNPLVVYSNFNFNWVSCPLLAILLGELRFGGQEKPGSLGSVSQDVPVILL